MNISRKFLLTGVLIISIALETYSQRLIPQAGLTYSGSSLKSKDTQPHSTDVDFTAGIVAGATVQFFEDNAVGLQAGLFYIQKRSKSSHYAETQDGLKAIHTFNTKLNQIEVPLQLRYALMKFPN